MGANQSRTSSSSSSHSSRSPRSSCSSRSSHSSHSSHSLPHTSSRSRAAYHHTRPLLVEEEHYTPPQADLDIFGDGHGYAPVLCDPSSRYPSCAGYEPYLDGESYMTYATAEVPGYFLNQGGCQAGTAGMSLSRTHAIRAKSSPTARAGSRRDAMLRSQRSSRSSPRSSPSSSSSGPSGSSAYASFHDMGLAAPTPMPVEPSRFLVRPKPQGSAPFTGRFREEL